MALTVATNVASLNAQRNLNANTDSVTTSMERLSSGLRINSAKDDAAGLQLSNRLTSQVNGLGVAARNANDAISLAQTAEGALQESTNILHRMRDLSLQSANGTNASSDRLAIQEEISQLQEELDRIAGNTAFGDRRLLDGTFGSEIFQVGAQAGETINVSLGSFFADDIGAQTAVLQKSVAGDAATVAVVTNTGNTAGIGLGGIGMCQAAGSLNTYLGTTGTVLEIGLIGAQGSATASFTETASAFDVQKAIQLATPNTGVDADARTTVALDFNMGGATPALTGEATITFELRGMNGDPSVQAPVIKADFTNTEDLSSISNAINAVTSETGISASLSAEGDLVLTSERGDTIEISNLALSGAASTTNLAISAQTFEYEGDVTDSGQQISSVTLVSGSAAALVGTMTGTTGVAAFVGVVRTTSNEDYTVSAAADLNQTNAGRNISDLSKIEDVDVSTAIGSQMAIDVIDGALSFIDKQRATLGAVQNRLDSTISNLNNVAENSAASRSRIRDTDFAVETASLTRSQILQQASTSILAQSNQLPQAALSLLG
ncbi:flagellin [Colwelliaceae bacterium 6471]